MAPKGTPAPIDRPLSKSYLREFTGWSTAYSPGLSDPTSLREMSNVLIGRDGSAVIRPALRNLFGEHWWYHTDEETNNKVELNAIDTWETFFMADGSKAILFPLRLKNNAGIRFYAATYNELTGFYNPPMSLAEAGFVKNGEDIESEDDEIVFSNDVATIKMLQIDNKIFVLANNEPLILIDVATYNLKIFPEEGVESPAFPPLVTYTPSHNLTPSEGPARDDTLHIISASHPEKNTATAAVFYTYINDLGETLGSPVALTKLQILTAIWPVANPSSSVTDNGEKLNITVYEDELPEGATGLNIYYAEWSEVSASAIEAALVYSGEFIKTFRMASDDLVNSTRLRFFPNEETDLNTTIPLVVQNGLVAADRLILVGDGNDPARVHWSANEPGAYGNMDVTRGAGNKTLTQGELQLPSSVVLWQNPQSVDTLTILCEGVDSYSTAYYMAPGEINTQNESISFMAFEQTNATPGTVSPFGVRVFNNALYHPLEDQLMKTTANNYNINHKKMTEMIGDRWLHLRNKQRIRSEELDGRLYYIVDNPFGGPVPEGCNGNELWILDGSGDNAMWSRFAVPAVALKKVVLRGMIYMGVVTPESIMYLDTHEHMDQVRKGTTGNYTTSEKAIPWYLQTNTQGANRAHDAWAHLQQVAVTFGSFFGTMRYGIKSWTIDGKRLDMYKTYRQPVEIDMREGKHPLPFDHDDYLLVRRDVKEWFFTASSAVDPETNEVLPSYGQISLVQYRFTPVTVNVGYEYGSVETFEYGHADSNWTERTNINGIPIPALDPRRP